MNGNIIVRDSAARVWKPWQGSLIQFQADVEIDGTNRLNIANVPSSTGSNTIVSVAGGQRIKVYKAIANSAVNYSGTSSTMLELYVGATRIGALIALAQYGVYPLMTDDQDFYVGADGEDLTITVPAALANNVVINIGYELI